MFLSVKHIVSYFIDNLEMPDIRVRSRILKLPGARDQPTQSIVNQTDDSDESTDFSVQGNYGWLQYRYYTENKFKYGSNQTYLAI